jgi:hypothetical protein
MLQSRVSVPGELKLVLHRNKGIPLLCPLPATWVEIDPGQAASALVRQIECQLAGEPAEPIFISPTLESPSRQPAGSRNPMTKGALNPMKTTTKKLILGAVLAAAAGFTATNSKAQTVLSDDFTGATIDGTGGFVDSATNWYSFNSNAAGVPVTLNAFAGPSPMNGNAIQFSGGSSNGLVVGGFSSVTLDTPGESLTLTLNYRYTGAPASGQATLGLFSDNGTPVTANSFGSRTEIFGDGGYEVQKLATSGTSDLSVYGGTEGASAGDFFYFTTGPAPLTTATTGVTPSLDTAAVYTETLTLTLAGNGTDLLLDSSWGVAGGSTFTTTQQTILAADVLTYEFNQIVFSPSQSGGGTTLMDNVLLTNVIPEPSVVGLVCCGMALLFYQARRRARARLAVH